MKKFAFSFLVLSLFASTKASAALESVEQIGSRGQVSIEGLGQALLYSLFGSYRIVPNVALNAGISYWAINASSGSSSVDSSLFMLPLSASVMMGGQGGHHFELLGGGTFVIGGSSITGNSLQDDFSDSLFIPTVGAGYRYWPALGGLHFRGTLYGLVVNGFHPWFGVSLGYAFM